MQKITDKAFDNKFKLAFEEMEVAPPTDLFAKIEKEIHQKKSKRLFFYVAAASVAAILAIGFVWEMQSAKSDLTPKMAMNFPQKKNKDKIEPPKNNITSEATLTAKRNGKNQIKKVGKKAVEKALPKPDAKDYNENIAIIQDQKPEGLEGENIVVTQDIQSNKKIDDKEALAQTKVVELPLATEGASKESDLSIRGLLPKETTNKALAISEVESGSISQNRKHKFIAGLFRSLKQRVTDVTSEVVSSNNNSTTIDLGFVAITKYKN